MTILLTLTVLALIAIAIWQITKIFELSQPKKENTQVADDDDNRWNGQMMFAFLIFIYAITLFSFWKWGDVLLPDASSEHGIEYDNLMWISFAIIFFTQTITQALLHYFAYKYRGEKGKKALFYADNDRLENRKRTLRGCQKPLISAIRDYFFFFFASRSALRWAFLAISRASLSP